MAFQKRKDFILLFLLFPFARLSLQAQSSSFFVKRGNNISSVSCGGILFAPLINSYHQAFGAGAAWPRKQVDLREPFHTSFILDFTDTTAIDGGAFVFQTDTNRVGEAFNGFGYRKIEQPTGTYIWIVKAIDYRSLELFKKGTVTLIR